MVEIFTPAVVTTLTYATLIVVEAANQPFRVCGVIAILLLQTSLVAGAGGKADYCKNAINNRYKQESTVFHKVRVRLLGVI